MSKSAAKVIVGGRSRWPKSELFWNVIPLGVAILDRRLEVVHANKAFRQFSPKDFNPYFKTMLSPLFRRAIKKGGKVLDMPLCGRRLLNSGRPDQWRISLFPRRHHQGAVDELVISVQNVMEFKRQESYLSHICESLPTAVAEQEKQFHALADAAPVMIWQSGLDKGCVYVNKEMMEFTGRGVEEQVGDGWCKGVHPEDVEESVRTYENAFEARRPFRMEYRLMRYDHEYRWVVASGDPTFDLNGTFRGYMGSCIDITEIKQARLETEQTRETLFHSRRVAALGEMAASMAHELNQPLSAILSNAQAGLRQLKNKPEDLAPIQDILTDIVADDKRAGEVIRGLRALMKKKGPSGLETLHINDVIQVVVSLCHGSLLSRETRAAVNVADDLPMIRADAVQLQQVLFNLIMNGLDAMESIPAEKRVLTIRTFAPDSDTVQVSVKDTGVGLPEDLIQAVFQPFFTTKKEGLGMGLSITRTIIEAHKGRLWAENNVDGGATFHISLPATHD